MVIGFDVCQEGNSFSLGLLRYPPIYLLLAKRPCQDKFVYVVRRGASPPSWPSNWGPFCAIYSLASLQKAFLMGMISH